MRSVYMDRTMGFTTTSSCLATSFSVKVFTYTRFRFLCQSVAFEVPRTSPYWHLDCPLAEAVVSAPEVAFA